MMNLVGFAAFAAALSLTAGSATAGSGQCYNVDGKPTGPAYDVDAPDEDWIRFVIARGGRCKGSDPIVQGPPSRLNPHEVPNHRHLERFRLMRRD
jgi:hypothetical protein